MGVADVNSTPILEQLLVWARAIVSLGGDQPSRRDLKAAGALN